MLSRRVYSGIIVMCCAVFLYVAGAAITHEIPIVQQVASLITPLEKDAPRILFVGDIMLGRHVESLMQEWGKEYPFVQAEALIKNYDLTIGNFEGIVTEEHVQAPSMTFQFSIRNEYLTHLRDIGFDVLSLANNHSFDYGSEAFTYTQEICKTLKIVCGGSPVTTDEDSIFITRVGLHNFGFLFLQTVTRTPDIEEVQKMLAILREKSDHQVAFVHWGDEYELIHNTTQEVYAQMLIENGIDVVVGHHPHVVQDVGIYQGKPIFYSLGNFVFDQYFSDEVQEGLGLSMEVDDTVIRYRLIPFKSNETQSQPRALRVGESQDIFERILGTLSPESGADTEEGVLTIPYLRE